MLSYRHPLTGPTSRDAAFRQSLQALASGNPSRIDDKELLRAIVDRKQEAVAELYDRFSSMLLALAYRVLGNSQDAEEILQEAFLQVWNQAARYDPKRSSVSTWLVLITRSRAIDRLRSRQVQHAHRDGGSAGEAGLAYIPDRCGRRTTARETAAPRRGNVEAAPRATSGLGVGLLRWLHAKRDRRADRNPIGHRQDSNPAGHEEASSCLAGRDWRPVVSQDQEATVTLEDRLAGDLSGSSERGRRASPGNPQATPVRVGCGALSRSSVCCHTSSIQYNPRRRRKRGSWPA